MISINIICRKERTNAAGLAPVVIRVTKSRKHATISTRVKIYPKDWNKKKARVKPTNKNYKQINAQLSSKYSKVERFALELELKNKNYSAKQFREMYLAGAKTNVVQYFRNWIKQNKNAGRITHSTKIKYVGIVDKLSLYTNGNLPVEEFNEVFCEKYHKHLIDKHKNSINTIASNMRCLRAVANSMIRDRIIKVDDNPFIRYKIKTGDTERRYLTIEEVDKIRRYRAAAGTKLESSRLVFLFCYETGLRIGDALHLRVTDYDGEYIRYYSQKTKSQECLLLSKKAKEIIDILNNEGNLKRTFVFGFLDDKLLSDEVATLNNQKSCTALINKNLKLIGTRAGVDTKFSTHYGRHSMATHALAKGLSYAEVKGILNHKDVKTTQHYAKVINLMKDSAIRKLESK